MVGGGKVVGLVNLDMPILTYDFKDVVAFGAEHSTIGEAVARAIASEGVSLVADPEPEQVSFVRTDHYMFVKQGVPAVSLDTGPANGGAAQNDGFPRAPLSPAGRRHRPRNSTGPRRPSSPGSTI